LWHKIRTLEDPKWTKRYHSTDPREKAFGGRVEIRFKDGKILADELAVANAHTLGASPWVRKDYVSKFNTLASMAASENERRRFERAAGRLAELKSEELSGLNVVADSLDLKCRARDTRGIF
jgi:2-methylcitrate dehydratase